MFVSLGIEYDADASMWASFGHLHFWWDCGTEDAQDVQQVHHQWIQIWQWYYNGLDVRSSGGRREQVAGKFKSIRPAVR